MTRSTIQRQFGHDLAYYRRELKPMAREATAQDEVRVFGMMIDHEVFVGRQRVHAGLGFAQSPGSARHPLLQRSSDWLNVADQVYLTVDMLRVRQVPKAVKGRFDSIAEIRKAIEWRGKASPVDQKCREIRCIVGIGPGQKPSLDIALHANADANGPNGRQPNG